MVQFGKTRRALLAKLLSDAANLTAAVFVFGQFISSRSFSAARFVWGLGLWMVLAAAALAVAGREEA